MDVKIKTEPEEVDLPDLVDPQSFSDENCAKQEKHPCPECSEDFNCEFLLNVHKMIHDETHYCSICKRVIQNNFKEHVMEKHFNQCNICFKNFSHKRSLDSHMENHTGELKYIKCDKCDKVFRQRGGLYTHMRSYHDGIKPYPCKECDGTFTTSSSLKKHLRNIHNSMNPKCPKIAKTNEETGRNSLIKTVSCDICYEEFPNKRELDLHNTQHFVSNTCQLCGKGFKKLQHVKNHLFRHHYRTEKCKYCDKLFHKQLLEKHMQIHQKKTTVTSFCEICNKTFGSISSLKRHTRIHRNERCSICGMPNIKSMEKHLEAHREGKVQKCELCNKRVADFERHNAKIHKNTQFLFCTKCPEKFQSLAERTVHNTTVHFATKKCPGCKKHMDVADLEDHVRTYHPDCIYDCEYCSKVIFGISSYNIHLEGHRKKVFHPFKCTICLRSWKSETGLKTHSCFPSYHCHLCNKHYILKRSYKTHMILQHSPNIITDSITENMNVLEIGNKKLYQCKRCFLTISKIRRRHVCALKAPLVRKRMNKCNMCGFLGASMSVMRRHCFLYHENENDWVTIHFGKRSNKPQPYKHRLYKCHCGKQFHYERSLNDHRSKCLFVKPLKCRICESRFDVKRYLYKHLMRFHVPTIMKAPLEEKHSENVKRVGQLRRKVIPNDSVITYKQKKKIKCSICNFSCYNPKLMRHHRRTNHANVQYFYTEDFKSNPELERNVCGNPAEDTPDGNFEI